MADWRNNHLLQVVMAGVMLFAATSGIAAVLHFIRELL